jgi:hypothetical protein
MVASEEDIADDSIAVKVEVKKPLK